MIDPTMWEAVAEEWISVDDPEKRAEVITNAAASAKMAVENAPEESDLLDDIFADL